MHRARREHNEKMSKLFIMGLWLHIPIFAALAYFFKTELWVALGLSSFLAAGPTVSFRLRPASLSTIIFTCVTYMFFSGILIHLGKGMIEWHFHIFCWIAIMAAFGSLSGILAAAATIAVHHLAFFFLIPTSLFNYDAGLGIVFLHAAFVILESLPALYLAKKMKTYIDMEGTIFAKLEDLGAANQKTSENLESSALELASSSTEQSNAVQETVSAIAEIRSMISVASEKVNESIELSSSGSEMAQKGNNSVQMMSQGMNRIESSISQLEKIKAVIDEINSKTEVINDIVFKTQLLSFNASIEAARAGEHGRGFAVVAQEVGNLAQMSGVAAKEIEELIVDSNEKVNTIVENIRKNVEDGKVITDDVVDVFSNISGSLDNIVSSVQGVSQANEEQEKGIDEVGKAMEQLSQAAQRNQEESESISKLSRDMTEVGESLSRLIASLTKEVKVSTKVETISTPSKNEVNSPEAPANRDIPLEDLAGNLMKSYKEQVENEVKSHAESNNESVNEDKVA